MFERNANHCFVCGPRNSSGLRVRFALHPKGYCHAQWTSTQDYMGYDGVTHGGILFSLLDDVMANLFFLQGEICVTAKAEIRFRNPLQIGETVLLQSKLTSRRRNLAVIEASATREHDGLLIASSNGHFMITGKLSADQLTELHQTRHG